MSKNRLEQLGQLNQKYLDYLSKLALRLSEPAKPIAEELESYSGSHTEHVQDNPNILRFWLNDDDKFRYSGGGNVLEVDSNGVMIKNLDARWGKLHTYRYDENGRITEEHYRRITNYPRGYVRKYKYDDEGQLVMASHQKMKSPESSAPAENPPAIKSNPQSMLNEVNRGKHLVGSSFDLPYASKGMVNDGELIVVNFTGGDPTAPVYFGQNEL